MKSLYFKKRVKEKLWKSIKEDFKKILDKIFDLSGEYGEYGKCNEKELWENVRDSERMLNKIFNISDMTEITSEILQEKVNDARKNLDFNSSFIPTYIGELLEWYLKDVNKVRYVDKVIREGGVSNLEQILTEGQYLYWREIFNRVITVCIEEIEKLKTEKI